MDATRGCLKGAVKSAFSVWFEMHGSREESYSILTKISKNHKVSLCFFVPVLLLMFLLTALFRAISVRAASHFC